MNKLITILLFIISISTFELNQSEQQDLNRFKNFLNKKGLTVNDKNLFYRSYLFKRAKKRLENLNKSGEYTLELNEFSYLNDEELRSRLGLGVDGDYDEYQHLLKKVNTNPEKLERFLKFRIRNKMKAIKHDKKLRRIRFCKLEKNKQKEVCKNQNESVEQKDLEDEEDKSTNPFEEGTLFYDMYQLGGKDILDVDFEREGLVTEVKNQQACGACVAFTTIGALESAYLIENGKYLDLSEQELLQNLDMPCLGSYPAQDFMYILNYGVTDEKSLEYVFKDPSYQYNAFNPANFLKTDTSNMNKYHMHDVVGMKDRTMLSYLTNLSFRPITTSLEIYYEFFSYKTGILEFDEECNGNPLGGHSVLAVGYHIDIENPKESYIRFKNSYGPYWGENGYFNLRLRNLPSGSLLPCEMASTYGYYAIVNNDD